MANEIARELPRDGKSVSKESYYVMILVCAKKGEGEGLANLFIAIGSIYAYRTERHLFAHFNILMV